MLIKLLVASIVSFEFLSAAPRDCQKLLTGAPNATLDAIAYLGTLFQSHTLTKSQLLDFKRHLDSNELINPISEEEAELSTTAHIHREGIEARLRKSGVDRSAVRSWVNELLQERIKTDGEKKETHDATKSVVHIPLHPIEGGQFPYSPRSPNGRDMTITLTHEIGVMETQFTHAAWVELFDESPLGEDNEQNRPRFAAVRELPIVNITWWSAVVAANKLSVRDGLPPSYDLSHIKWEPGTRAEDGTLATLERDVDLVINAPGHDIYRARGYRLPTLAKQNYFIQLEAKANASIPIEQRAWFKFNSGGAPQPVGLKHPLEVGKNKIFDLLGNVSEWGHDWYPNNSGLFDPSKTTDPTVPKNTQNFKTLRAGHFRDGKGTIMMATDNEAPNARETNIGVRFVRTLR